MIHPLLLIIMGGGAWAWLNRPKVATRVRPPSTAYPPPPSLEDLPAPPQADLPVTAESVGELAAEVEAVVAVTPDPATPQPPPPAAAGASTLPIAVEVMPEPAPVSPPTEAVKTAVVTTEAPTQPDSAATYTDPTTGLMWQRCAMGQQWQEGRCIGEAKRYPWQQAHPIHSDLAGYTDWRLPTKEELATIIRCSNGTPAIEALTHSCAGKAHRNGDSYHHPTLDPEQFPDTPENAFWSATPVSGNSDYSWCVSFSHGRASYGLHSNGYRVRLVRTANSTV